MAAHKQRRIGRPVKEPAPGTRVSLGLKVTPAIKKQLDAAAALTGRTQSQEAELRLENSFRDDDHAEFFTEAAYGTQVSAFLQLLGAALRDVTTQASAMSSGPAQGGDWISDRAAFPSVEAAIRELVDALRPANALPAEVLSYDGNPIGAGTMKGYIWRAAVGQAHNDERTWRVAALRRKLGPPAVEKLRARVEAGKAKGERALIAWGPSEKTKS